MNVYSFKDHTLAFNHPLVGPFVIAGQVGVKQYTVTMTTEKSAHDVAADGNVLVSAIAGDNGALDVQVQQTSDAHTYLLAWYNAILQALNEGDLSNWATMTATGRGITDGSVHNFSGVSPSKIPDKPYAAQGQDITWRLLAADVMNTQIQP